MDTATINQRGIAPIKPELDRIRAMENMPDVVAELVRLHRIGIGVLVQFRRPYGRQGFQPHHRRPDPGRPLPARSRILPQDRPEERRDSPALRGAHDEDVPVGGRIGREFRAGGAHGARVGDDSRQSLDGSRIPARSEQDLSHDDPPGSGSTGAQVCLGPVFSGYRSAGIPDAQRQPARLHQTDRGGPGELVDRFLARLLRLPPASFECANSLRSLRERGLRFLESLPLRHQGTAPADCPLRRHGRSPARRPSGTEVHRADLRRGRQGADHPTRGCSRKGNGGRHSHLALDDRRDQEGRARQVESHHQQCGLAQEVARIRQTHHRPRRFLR